MTSKFRPRALMARWRRRYKRDKPMPDMAASTGRIPGEQRCGAIGLPFGDCELRRLRNPDGTYASAYCLYHTKVEAGLLEPDEPPVYPVWPLPRTGYLLAEPSGEEVA